MLFLAKNLIVIVVKRVMEPRFVTTSICTIVKHDVPLERVHSRRKSRKVFRI